MARIARARAVRRRLPGRAPGSGWPEVDHVGEVSRRRLTVYDDIEKHGRVPDGTGQTDWCGVEHDAAGPQRNELSCARVAAAARDALKAGPPARSGWGRKPSLAPPFARPPPGGDRVGPFPHRHDQARVALPKR